jgi:hypothetical protein
MQTPRWLKSDIRYAGRLAEAGWDGAVSGWQCGGGRVFPPAWINVVWAPVTVGAAIGVLGAALKRKRRTPQGLAWSGLVGGAMGFGGGIMWAARDIANAAARGSLRGLGTVRDAHWIEKNPVAYG